jgi:hypothetical protein
MMMMIMMMMMLLFEDRINFPFGWSAWLLPAEMVETASAGTNGLHFFFR